MPKPTTTALLSLSPLSLALALGTALPLAAPHAAHAQQANAQQGDTQQGGCEMVGRIASQGNQPAQATVENRGDQTLYLFWVNYQGQLSDYSNEYRPVMEIAAGETVTFDAFEGHFYSVYSDPQSCVGLFGVNGPSVQMAYAVMSPPGSGSKDLPPPPEPPVAGTQPGAQGDDPDNPYARRALQPGQLPLPGDGSRSTRADPSANSDQRHIELGLNDPNQPQVGSGQPGAGQQGAGQPGTSAPAASGDIQRILDLVNSHRAKGATCTGTGRSYGPAPALQLHSGLSQAAEGWSRQMLQSGIFDHGDSNGRIAAICGPVLRAENIAGNPTAEGAVEGWMSSTSGHCDAIMNPAFRLVGIGKAQGGQYGSYWTQKFASQCSR